MIISRRWKKKACARIKGKGRTYQENRNGKDLFQGKPSNLQFLLKIHGWLIPTKKKKRAVLGKEKKDQTHRWKKISFAH